MGLIPVEKTGDPAEEDGSGALGLEITLELSSMTLATQSKSTFWNRVCYNVGMKR